MFGNVAEGSRKRRASPAIPDQVAGTFAQPSGSKAPRTQGLGLQAPEAPSAPGASRNSRGKQRERVEDGQSEPAWFPISSLNATLQSYNVGPPPGPPLFTLRFRQQPRYGVALNPAAESNRGARAHFLDPPPIVELLAQKNRDQALLSAAELFVRLELVAADDATSPPPPSNAMFGELLASPYILVAKGQHEKPEALFVYTHVCVKAQGKYRLRAEMFCSARTSITYVASVVSDAFQVYPILRQRPASDAPTALMKSLVRQGFKYKIRKSNQNNAPSAQPRGSRHPPGTAPSAINGTGVSGALPGSRNAAGAPPPVLDCPSDNYLHLSALLPSSNWSSGSELNGDNRSLSTPVQALQLSAAASAAAASAGSAARGPAPIISEPFRSRDEGEPSLSGIGRQWVPSGHPSRGGQVPAPAELAASLPREGEEPARFRPPAPSDRYGTYPGGSGSSTSSHQEVEEPARFRPPAPTDRYGTYPGGGSSSTSSHRRMS
ncbi:hypothetical protein CF326_g3326 [Tilletia indica]|nr:hypothetical protein CF326_g3326 [Tilletia indica]